MKQTVKYLILFILISTIGLTGCEKDNFLIYGKWKLEYLETTKDYKEYERIECSDKNIIYAFQKNRILFITGSIPNDFKNWMNVKDFSVGKHTYKFYYPSDCPNCGPSYLQIDGNRKYIGNPPIWNIADSMCISGKKTINGELFHWSKVFSRLN